MKNAIQETARRRAIQEAYNKEHGITPTTVFKPVSAGIGADLKNRREANEAAQQTGEVVYITEEFINELQTEMLQAAEDLEFERAGILRDRINRLQESIGEPLNSVDESKPKGRKGRRKSKVTKVPRPRKER